jgi:hypothetical protein
MTELKIRILEDTGCFLQPQNNTYFHMPKEQLVSIFLPNEFTYIFVDKDDKADICISSIQLPHKSLLRENEVNIMICIENCKRWNWYVHYKNYREYDNNSIDIFIYNHISSLYKKTDKIVGIPTVYMRINYYNSIKNYYEKLQQLSCSFRTKKFCLLINKSSLNNNINKFIDMIKIYGDLDHISMYNEKISNISCYNSIELLEIFNLYKFIVCFENSYNDGYITEKIFNCFLAKTIPIYSGSPIVDKFLNTDSFINIPEDQIDTFDMSIIDSLNNDEERYNNMININKISANYSDEEYKNEMVRIINNKLERRQEL